METTVVTPNETHHGRLNDSTVSRLRLVARRIRTFVVVEGTAWTTGFLLIALLADFALDYGLRGLQWSMRLALLSIILSSTAWIAWRRLLGPLVGQRITIADIARLVERKYPNLSSVLISAVRFSAGEVGAANSNAPALVASVIRRADQETQAADFGVVVNPTRARRATVAMIATVAFPLILVLVRPGEVGLWFDRNILLKDIAWPKQTKLVVKLNEGTLFGALGDDLIVEAHAEGVMPREVEILFETASGKTGREMMVTVGNPGAYRYRYTFKKAREDFVFRLRGGDDRTDWYTAKLLERPRVASSQMQLLPPAYTRLDPITLGDGQRSAQVLPGTTVTLWMTTNKPVPKATLLAGDEVVTEASREAERWRVDLLPDATTTLHFELVDEVGLNNRHPMRFSVRVMRDEPPTLRLQFPGVGEMITPEAVLPIELSCSDTYGLASVVLRYERLRDKGREGTISLVDFVPRVSQYETDLAWPVLSAEVKPGDRIMFSSRALDFDNISGPNMAQSPEVTFRVVTPEELLGELARREQEFRMDFERLVEAQERIRGELLTLLGRSSHATADQLAPLLTPLERRQRNVASSVNVLRQQFQQILGEQRINRVDTQEEVDRLEKNIIEPLTELARRDLIAAADILRRWSRSGSQEQASLVDPKQAAIVAKMRAVLDTMLQWEGYHEVVTMLRDILRLQSELRDEAKEAADEDTGGIFED